MYDFKPYDGVLAIADGLAKKLVSLPTLSPPMPKNFHLVAEILDSEGIRKCMNSVPKLDNYLRLSEFFAFPPKEGLFAALARDGVEVQALNEMKR